MADTEETPQNSEREMSLRAPAIDVIIEDDAWTMIDLQSLVAACHNASVQIEPALARDAVILFSNDNQLRILNLQFRGRDSATNVLSFPSDEPSPMSLGDIVIGFETVEREACDAGIALKDHTAHMIVHGLLHLVGYDHEVDTDAVKMETAEREILETLGIADPYREFNA